MKVLSSSHAKHCLGYHIVFCPKYRHQVLSGAIEVKLKQVIGETCKTYGWTLHSLEVMPDHVHCLYSLTTQPRLLRLLKPLNRSQPLSFSLSSPT